MRKNTFQGARTYRKDLKICKELNTLPAVSEVPQAWFPYNCPDRPDRLKIF